MIYVLRTKRKDGGLEFRILKESELYPSLNDFSSSPVYDDYADVLKIITKLQKNFFQGVREITSFSNSFFHDIVQI